VHVLEIAIPAVGLLVVVAGDRWQPLRTPWFLDEPVRRRYVAAGFAILLAVAIIGAILD
jgi:hypothetical protein